MRRWTISKGLVASGTGNQIGEWREQQHVQGPPSPPVEVIEAKPVIEALREWVEGSELGWVPVEAVDALRTQLETDHSPPPHGQAE